MRKRARRPLVILKSSFLGLKNKHLSRSFFSSFVRLCKSLLSGPFSLIPPPPPPFPSLPLLGCWLLLLLRLSPLCCFNCIDLVLNQQSHSLSIRHFLSLLCLLGAARMRMREKTVAGAHGRGGVWPSKVPGRQVK